VASFITLYEISSNPSCTCRAVIRLLDVLGPHADRIGNAF
jgi:hypothetical protein